MSRDEPNDHEFRNVLALPFERRVDYFFKRCVDLDAVWIGRDAEGWITLQSDRGDFLPVWPARRYAAACLLPSAWPGVEYMPIELDTFLGSDLAKLGEAGFKIGIFVVPDDDMLILTVPEARDAFEAELNTRLFRSPNWDPDAKEEDIDFMELLKPGFRASMKAKPKGKLP